MGRDSSIFGKPVSICVKPCTLASVHRVSVITAVNKVLLRQVKLCSRGSSFGHTSLMKARSSKGCTRTTVALILSNSDQTIFESKICPWCVTTVCLIQGIQFFLRRVDTL